MAFDLNRAPMVICRTGWMLNYDGDRNTWLGRHRYVAQGRGDPHEMFNFRTAPDGYVYGYVQIKDGNSLNISRLGVPITENEISGITVVWCSQFRGNQGLRVHGWHKNTSAFRYGIKRPKEPSVHLNIVARFRVNAGTATLLEEPERQFEIPSGQFGQADVFYVDEHNAALARNLRNYIDAYGASETPSERWVSEIAFGSSAADRKRVEEAAISTAKQFLRDHLNASAIDDRQKDKCGWDLEAHVAGAVLRIEVKGRGTEQQIVGLTVNEYRAFRAAQNDPLLAKTYCLLTVNNALAAKPDIGFFRYKRDRWTCEFSSRSLQANVMEMALVSLVPIDA